MSREDLFNATETVFIEILCFLLGIHVKACLQVSRISITEASKRKIGN